MGNMHMVHAGLSLVNTGKIKSKSTVKQKRAQSEHDKWLRQQGLHPEQIQARQNMAKKKPAIKETYITARDRLPSKGNGFAPIVSKRSIFDPNRIKDYEDDPIMAEREIMAIQQAEEKKKRIAPAYSKGAYQYISEGTNIKEIGRKL